MKDQISLTDLDWMKLKEYDNQIKHNAALDHFAIRDILGTTSKFCDQ